MVNISRLKPFRVLVAGDLMLDRYTHGSVGRISPEAPVPVLHVRSEQSLPGGAGNVALNLAALGANVFILGRIGSDLYGKHLQSLLEEEGIDTSHIITEKDYVTPVKNRILGGTQQMLRIDHEQTHPLPDELANFEMPDIDLIAISDYNKGFLTNALLKKLIAYGRSKNIPVLVDPKGSDFTKYKGATLIKPNLKEAHLASNCEGSLQDVAKALIDQCQTELLLITRSKEGMSLFNKDGDEQHFPVRSKEVQDVTGAGDTVLAALALAIANKMSIESAVNLANIAAGLSIEKLGCARLTLAEIAERMLHLDATCKIFDENALYALTKALDGKEFTVLGLESADSLSTKAFTAIKSIKGKLIVYIRDEHPHPDFVSLLTALNEVDFLVIKSESLAHLCDELKPTNAYLFTEGKLQSLEAATALLN